MVKQESALGSRGLMSLGSLFQRFSAIIIFIFLVVIFSLTANNFFEWSNAVNIMRQTSVIGIVAIGQSLIIIAGGIDLSVGSMMSLAGCVMAVSNTMYGLNQPSSILLGLAAGTLVGFINGLLVTKLHLQDFIATLGTFTAVLGVALMVTAGYPISGLKPETLFLGSKMVLNDVQAFEGFRGIPLSIIVFAGVALAGWII